MCMLTTHYGLDGLGIESFWGQDFLHVSILALGPIQPLVQWVVGLFLRGKVAGPCYLLPTCI